MKLDIGHKELTSAVAFAIKACRTRPDLVILSGLLLEAKGDTLHVSGFDLETSAEASVAARVDEPGKVLVNGHLLWSICKNLQKKPITLTEDGSKVVLKCGSSKFSLGKLQAEDFPALPLIPERIGVVSAEKFMTMVNQVAIAAATDTTIPSLTGVRFDFTGESISMCSTDRYRLSVRNDFWTPKDTELNVTALVPAKTLIEASRELSGDVEIFLDSGENPSVFALGDKDFTITCRLLENKFPDYEKLLPTEFPYVVTFDNDILFGAITRASLVNDKDNNRVKISFIDDEVVIDCGSGVDEATEKIEYVDSNISEDFVVAFDPDYLRDALKASRSPQVVFSFTDPRKPCVITALDENGKPVTGFRFMLMPKTLVNRNK